MRISLFNNFLVRFSLFCCLSLLSHLLSFSSSFLHSIGGNRRKVSLAVALLGAPPTVYLDEPSTGLDPVASRLMWRLLSKIATAKTTAIVLTTHNMLECEAVCTRVCIMKLGEMVCLGDSQHLRSTHGTGFLLELNLVNSKSKEHAKQVRNCDCFIYFSFSYFPSLLVFFLSL
jgi:ABC-type uncharacterized transport system ATPase subunit